MLEREREMLYSCMYPLHVALHASSRTEELLWYEQSINFNFNPRRRRLPKSQAIEVRMAERNPYITTHQQTVFSGEATTTTPISCHQ